MSSTTGTKETRILRVLWQDGGEEYYYSISALFARRSAEDVGASYGTVKNMLSRNAGRYQTKKCIIVYVPMFVAVRGPRK
jgi:hypothetical protein